jgi:hypothetical protein
MAKKESKIILPRQDKEGKYYISYSQISKFKRSKREYIRQYFFGEDTASEALKKYGAFGHLIGEAFENNDFSAFEGEDKKFMEGVKKYDEFEREIKLKMNGFYVKGFIDSNTKPSKHKKPYIKKILDYKTGDVDKKRTDYSSPEYNQLEIYASALKQEFGKLPDIAHVVLIGRNGNAFNGEELTLSRRIAIIERSMDQDLIDVVLKDVQETAEEISRLYQVFLKFKNA